jgi:hypothetical protein
MAFLNLIAPWFSDRQRGVLRVKSVQVSTALPWATYYRYEYLNGVGSKLSQIPRHICGGEKSAIEQLERAQRLISYMDATGCRPIATNECPQSHKEISLLDRPDHVTYWHGPDGEPLVLIEPYTSREDLQDEIFERKLTAFVLPYPGIYSGGGGKTTSVTLAEPRNVVFLHQLSLIEWNKPMGVAKDINWFEALNLGKGRQS